MKMRNSRTLSKLRGGEVARCMKLNLADPRVAELAAMSGFDCVWLDMEHTATNPETVENQIRAAKVHDVDTVVRVRRGSYSDLIGPLEMDATGIMVPHVMSLEDAKEVVRLTRFHPIGRRPIDGGNSDGAYAQIPGEQYIRQANSQRFVIIQIEDPEPMDELDQIAQLDGVDMLFFGPSDFSHALGVPFQCDDARVLEACRRVAEAALRHGKVAGTVASDNNISDLLGMGYRFLNVGADVIGLGRYFRTAAALLDSISTVRL